MYRGSRAAMRRLLKFVPIDQPPPLRAARAPNCTFLNDVTIPLEGMTIDRSSLVTLTHRVFVPRTISVVYDRILSPFCARTICTGAGAVRERVALSEKKANAVHLFANTAATFATEDRARDGRVIRGRRHKEMARFNDTNLCGLVDVRR